MPEPRKLFLKAELVGKAVSTLRASQIHPTFAGYLCAKREERRAGSSTGLRPPFREFFDEYLCPANGTEERPYLRPFNSNGDLSSEPWINPNVAGSYAPSSLRERSPFRRIFSITPGPSPTQWLWSFSPESAQIAQADLLHGKRVKAWALAAFLYRDFQFESDGDLGSLDDLVEIFRDEFAFRASVPQEAEQFQVLFDDSIDQQDLSDAFVVAQN